MKSFVDYLNRYTTVSSEHEAAFDEYLSADDYSPPGGKLRLDTKVEAFVRQCFSKDQPPSIVLTGNAGDGKTYLCRQIIEGVTGRELTEWSDKIDWTIERGTLTLRIVKDLSELDEASGARTLHQLAENFSSALPKDVFLIAANEGRLRKLLGGDGLEDLHREVDSQLESGPDLESNRLIVINLNKITTSSYVPQALAWLTKTEHWQDTACPDPDTCPIHHNVWKLRDQRIQQRIQFLYKVIERMGTHITIRDMLTHLAFTVTAGKSCQNFARQPLGNGFEPHEFSYYENMFGESANEVFQEKMMVLKHLRRFDVGHNSVYELDDFIINGDASDEGQRNLHEDLLAPALDLGGKRFAQDRDMYLRGISTITKAKGDPPFLRWLPHCRRKLFFEWGETDLTNRLFPFLHLPEYFKLLEQNGTLREKYRDPLVLGLNRAFTGLFLNDTSHLYLTSQYADTVEQQVPVIKVKLPVDNVDIDIEVPKQDAYDYDYPKVILEIFPPKRVHVDEITWTLDLLSFEYLMRRANGSTPNVLAAECELEIRQLKDELLSRFRKRDSSENKIEFFAADRNKYDIKTLWVEGGKLRA